MLSAISSLASSGSGVWASLAAPNANDAYYMTAEDKQVFVPQSVGSKTGSKSTDKTNKSQDKTANVSVTGKKELSEEEKKAVEELKKRDQVVRTHEAAHMAAGSGLVRGGASYSTQTGPDGQSYAIGGEVSIDMAPEKDPAATVTKMQQVQRAALAPAEPSGQDRAVAAQAAKIAAEAEKQLREESSEKTKNIISNKSSSKSNKVSSAYSQNSEQTMGKYIDALVAGSSQGSLKAFSRFA